MGITVLNDVVAGPQPTAENQPDGTDRRIQPSAGAPDAGFDKALRVASVAWHPERVVVDPAPIEDAVRHALPLVLEAWRAIERELASSSVASPEREMLEANAEMLRAMYQRLFFNRVRT